jgi:bifunctional DNA-binding transcriptional regulator/antitoxin component of YhaV-PrlF toxin-antitoxin module
MVTTLTRTTDKKGRITLPKHFADHLVIIEQVDETEVRIRKAEAIPQKELWLWKNPVAAGMILLGIEEAKAGEFVPGPDLDADPSERDAIGCKDTRN